MAGCALRQVLLTDTAEVRPQESLLYFTVSRSVRGGGETPSRGYACANDAFDQREAGGGNAAQQTTVV